MTAKPVTLESLRMDFGATTAVADLDLAVEAGELFCLLGPSGCGKTTTLRSIAGLATPTSGRIDIGGRAVTDLPSAQRDTSMVFQNWALFPRRTALENVAFGPKVNGVDRETRRERARELLATVDMEGHADQRPGELSGGQKQRVALARSLAVEPGVLLLDEPLSNLDKRLRQELRLELKRIHDQVGTTMIHVTHDQTEAFTLGDRIGIMRDGELVQVGKPRDVYEEPATRFVEEFLGDVTVVEGEVVRDGTRPLVRTPIGDVAVPASVSNPETDTVAVALRPESASIERAPATTAGAQTDGTGAVRLNGTVSDVLYQGSQTRYYVDVHGDVEPFVEYSRRTDPNVTVGTDVTLRWDPEAVRFYDATGERL